MPFPEGGLIYDYHLDDGGVSSTAKGGGGGGEEASGQSKGVFHRVACVKQSTTRHGNVNIYFLLYSAGQYCYTLPGKQWFMGS